MSDKATPQQSTVDSIDDFEAAYAAFKPVNKRRLIVRRFFRNRGAAIGFFVLVAVILIAFLAPTILERLHASNPAIPYYHPTDDLDFLALAAPPSGFHWLGTNQAGADLFSMLLVGMQKSLILGFAVGLATATIAAVMGASLAYFGGWFDRVGMWVLELLIMVPSLVIVAIVMNGRSAGLVALAIILIIFGWMGPARLIRALSFQQIDREYVKSARYSGVHPFRIVFRHVVPNIGSYLVLNISMGIWAAVLSEVAFSYLGIGVRVPDTSLGVLIQAASGAMQSYPWMFWAPLVALTLITGPLALMNDGLRDALDPTSLAGGKG
ncbi:ABC transporter permease [Micrococcales bacterium 31B]|nr:ABC transporter permease [Micrococcales bacterium 31B]